MDGMATNRILNCGKMDGMTTGWDFKFWIDGRKDYWFELSIVFFIPY
jgi:hypothetical protein